MKKQTRKQKFNSISIVGSLIVISFFLGFFVSQNTKSFKEISPFELNQLFIREEADFKLVEEVWNLINSKYVGKNNIDKKELIFGAISGMVKKLDDPYSVFFNKTETSQFLSSVSGRFEGIGVEISIRNEELIVVAPLKNTPAYAAGIKAGDRIIKIDGNTTQNITLEEAVSRMRGPKDTKVSLTILRDTANDEIEISITRARIDVPSVQWEMLDGNIAYVELIHFSETTSDDFSKIAQEILESSADRIILDLRNNPGGFLDASIEIAGWFFEEGETVVTEELADNIKRKHVSPGPASLKDFVVVVLQNEGSASAAEILAGALRDNNNVEIIGEKSFGKGSVQVFENLAGGTSLKLTVARWVTPSGQQINSKGIEPTIKVEESDERNMDNKDIQKEKAIEIIRSL